MRRGQFEWRGNSSLGYPYSPLATWPASRYESIFGSSKNLLWLFGGESNGYFVNDFSAFSDGIIFII